MKNIIPLNLGMSESFILRGKTSILVDTGMNVDENKFREIFQRESIKPEDISLIVITHGHSDHYAHVHFLKQLTGAKVLCHSKAAHYIKTGTNAEVVPRVFLLKILKALFKGGLKNYQPVIPDILIEDNYDLKEYGINGRIFPTPGHSDCSLSVVLDSGEAIIGDMLVGSPFAPHKPALALFANNETALIKSISRVIESGAEILYGSHGGPFRREEVIRLLKKNS